MKSLQRRKRHSAARRPQQKQKPGAIEALERLWIKRRREAELQHRGRISKSLLVEEAISRLARA